jgi:hypothetical protein
MRLLLWSPEFQNQVKNSDVNEIIFAKNRHPHMQLKLDMFNYIRCPCWRSKYVGLMQDNETWFVYDCKQVYINIWYERCKMYFHLEFETF